MAKHKANKNGSFGIRISCKGNVKKHAIIPAAVERVGNAMREAFLNIQVSKDAHTKKGDIVSSVLNSAKRNAGNHHYGRGWTANVSPRTLKKLTEEGVFA